MVRLIVILECITQGLNNYSQSNNNQEINDGYDICTFLDSKFPKQLNDYIFKIPIVYYYGDIDILSKCNYILTIDNPSYYVQKAHSLLLQTRHLITNYDSNYSPAKISCLYDIIYCNDISIFNLFTVKLVVNFGLNLSNDEWSQLVSVIIGEVYVLAGYPTCHNFDFINYCCDNFKLIYALPTNIFIGSGTLPNLLIEKGVRPLILNENKGSFTCKN